MQQIIREIPQKLIYSFKEKNLRLQMSSFTHGKNIVPATNYLYIQYET